MSLSAATLLSGLLLAVSGGLLLWNNPAFAAALRAFPRSKTAALVLFGAGAAWFLWLFWHAAEADRFSFHNLLFVILAATAVLSFRLVPDFLAVRGAAVLVLLAAAHLLDAAFMRYEVPRRLFMVGFVYAAIAAAIYLGAAPYRLRDFLGWLYRAPVRARALGGVLLAYGALLVGLSFTY